MNKTMTKELTDSKDLIKVPKPGDIVEGKIIGKGRASIFVDLGIMGAGTIYGKEFYEAKDMIKGLKKGDSVHVKIVEFENEDGYIELSLKEAQKQISWESLKEKKKQRTKH